MSFLPGNESDKQRKQREYKEALDAQVQGRHVNNTAAAAGGAALPLINRRGQQPPPQPQQPLLLRQQYQFPADPDRHGAPPVPRPIGQHSHIETDLRSLMNQVDRISYAQSSSDEMLKNIQSTIMHQESKFKENLSSIQDTFVRLMRESDDRVMDINTQFRGENQKLIEASKNNIQNFVAINEELESVVNRQNVISDRMQSMSKYDAELSTKIEDMKQYFAKELEDFRNVVLRTAALAGESEQEREDKKFQWQITLASERFIEDQKSINERLTSTESSLMDAVNLLRSQQSEQVAIVGALSKQAAERPPIDINRILATEKNVVAQDKAIVGMERGISGLWEKLQQLESSWEKSSAEGFRRIQQEIRHDKEATNQAMNDLRSVVSTEITARRRDVEQSRIEREAMISRVDAAIATIRDEVKESTKYTNKYITAMEQKGVRSSQDVGVSDERSNNASGSGSGDNNDLLSLKFQSAMTATDAKVSSIASQVDNNLSVLKMYCEGVDDRLKSIERQLPSLITEHKRTEKRAQDAMDAAVQASKDAKDRLKSPRNDDYPPPSRHMNERLKNIEDMLFRLAAVQDQQQMGMYQPAQMMNYQQKQPQSILNKPKPQSQAWDHRLVQPSSINPSPLKAKPVTFNEPPTQAKFDTSPLRIRKGSPPPNFNQKYYDDDDDDDDDEEGPGDTVDGVNGGRSVGFAEFPAPNDDAFEGLRQFDDYLQQEEQSPTHQALYGDDLGPSEVAGNPTVQFAGEDFNYDGGEGDGFLPMEGGGAEESDDINMEEAEMMHYGATKLQANFRGFQGRKRVSEIRSSIDSLEPEMRGTDQDFPIEDDDTDAMHQGATRLQANFRGFMDRKAVDEKKAMIASFDPSDEAMQDGAAKLQANFRGFKDRKRVNEIKNEGNVDEEPSLIGPDLDFVNETESEAASVLQSRARGFLAKKQVDKLREEKQANKINEKANTNELRGEGVIAAAADADGDDDAASKQIDFNPEEGDDTDAMHQGATRLQANFRGFMDRKAVDEKKAMIASFDPSDEAMQDGAAKLQANFRGFKDRKRVNEIKNEGNVNEDAVHDFADAARDGEGKGVESEVEDGQVDSTNMENMLAAALGGEDGGNIDDMLAAGLNAGEDEDSSVRQSMEVKPLVVSSTDADEVDEGKYDVISDGDGLSARPGADDESPRYEDDVIETEETPVIEKTDGSEYEVREPKEHTQIEKNDEVLRAEEEESPRAIETEENSPRIPEAESGEVDEVEEESPRAEEESPRAEEESPRAEEESPRAEEESPRAIETEENSPRIPEAESGEVGEVEEEDDESSRAVDTTEQNIPRGEDA